MTPGWILDIFAGLMLAIAALSAARLALARSRGWGAVDVDVAHLLMGIAIAGILAARLTTFPDKIWAACFAAATAWFGYRALRHARASATRAVADGQYTPHLVHGAAMLYVFLALATAAGGGVSGSPGPAPQPLSLPALAFAFALALIGYSVWDLDQLSGRRYAFAMAAGGVPGAAGVTVRARAGAHAKERSGARAVLLAPAVTVGCRVATGITMALLLLLMI